jgi:hypothetical protein
VAYDYETGLVRGESSFLTGANKPIPNGCSRPTFLNQNLAPTRCISSQQSLSRWQKYWVNQRQKAQRFQRIKDGINRYLWIPKKGYYAQFIYGRNFKIVSPKAEALGESLCVLFGVADAEKAASIIAKSPVTAFGNTCIYPQIRGFRRTTMTRFGLCAIVLGDGIGKGGEFGFGDGIDCCGVSPCGVFLTNKENFVASNGDFAGTQINSSNMLLEPFWQPRFWCTGFIWDRIQKRQVGLPAIRAQGT